MAAKPDQWLGMDMSAGPPLSLGGAVRQFLRYGSPRLLVTGAIVSTGVRVWVGPWSWGDLIVVAAMFAFWPINEWLIHVFLLHAKPIGRLGLETTLSRKHREHHREPWRLELLFIPEHVVWIGVAAIPLGWNLFAEPALAWTGAAIHFALAANYEWTHYVAHVRYTPKSRRMQRLVRMHRLHHFRNETFWYGVSMTMGDTILRTTPDPKTTPVSPTCRTLGVDDAA